MSVFNTRPVTDVRKVLSGKDGGIESRFRSDGKAYYRNLILPRLSKGAAKGGNGFFKAPRFISAFCQPAGQYGSVRNEAGIEAQAGRTQSEGQFHILNKDIR